MNGPAESLRLDLQRIEQALEPFSTPVSDERPGLRWMADVLRARREHVRENLREAETTRLEVEVTSTDGGLSLPALGALLPAVQQALHAAAGIAEVDRDDVRWRALVLHASGISPGESSDGGEHTWTLTLRRGPGPHAAQPVAEDGRLLIDAALDALLERVGAGAVEPLAEVVRHHGLALELRSMPVTGEPRSATLDQAGSTAHGPT